MYEIGTRLAFRHGDQELSGIVNGEPIVATDNDSRITHVPVHVQDGNHNVLVAISNVVIVLDIADEQD